MLVSLVAQQTACADPDWALACSEPTQDPQRQGFRASHPVCRVALVPPSNAALQASLQASFRALHEANGLTDSLGVNCDIGPWGVGFNSDGTNPTTMSLQTKNFWTVLARFAVRF